MFGNTPTASEKLERIKAMFRLADPLEACDEPRRFRAIVRGSRVTQASLGDWQIVVMA